MNKDRAKNIGIFIVLHAIFFIPYLFIPSRWMLEGVSVAMLAFAIYNLRDYGLEAVNSFWGGDRSRAALALYGVVLLFLSAIWSRTYGIWNRAAGEPEWVDGTPIFAYGLYMLLIGLVFFRKASPDPTVPRQPSPWATWIAAIAIGLVLTATKVLEPVIMFASRLFARIF